MNEERNAEIIRRRKAGDLPGKIAAQMKLSRNIVAGVLDRADLCERGKSLRRAPHFQDKVGKVWLYGCNRTQTEVAQAFGVTQASISRWARKALRT